MDRFPVFIITYNLLSTTKNLVKDILRMNGQPFIVDNNSTYPPLLEWYSSLKNNDDIHVIRFPVNYGPQVVYDYLYDLRKTYKKLTGKPLPKEFIVTDCDLDLSQVPDDGLDVLYRLYAYCKRQGLIYLKIGFGLRIDDLPKKPYLNRTRNWEKQFFTKKVKYDGIDVNPDAAIDTTLHLFISDVFLHPPKGVPISRYGPAIRTYAPYMARHIPWYWTEETLDEESKYYLKHVNTNLPIAHSADLKHVFGF